MAEFDALAINMNRIGKNIEAKTNLQKRLFATSILREVVDRTPVKSGLAKGNWQVGLGLPVSTPLKRKSKGGAGVISSGTARIAKSKQGENIYISNLVPYIKKLNEGSSTQAPVAFIEVAIISGLTLADKIKLVD